MAVPDYQSIMLPLLRLAEDGQEHSLRAAIQSLADNFELQDSERKELLPSGRQFKFDNRVGWARTYLKKAGLLEMPRRGFFQITERGKEVLRQDLERIDARFLRRFEEFRSFQNREPSCQTSAETQKALETDDTPEEELEKAYQKLRQGLADELLQLVKQMPPEFFERLVVELMISMGYGGSRQEAGKALGKSGDEGIDGIISEDRLGLNTIYIQAKRWTDNVVGRPAVQQFAGALQGKGSKKGVFITTSTFSNEAFEYCKSIGSNIVLISGEQLAQYMIDYNVGVATTCSYEIKRIDSDYFSET
ncbi:restriction endonuclease [Halorhodospira halochloris]|uniref:winged helix-turn-helix domain-containing protein n=1 Tax=Halorhodospira halochloris TaxID=1052 RepID=UPI001EE95906|nr:restriction endonuclease [Halorhodospira halochloris]MCG5547516.1 restriction endonuclease [Halorhodospira halochloris]